MDIQTATQQSSSTKRETLVQSEKNQFPPVVSVLGHVDHGKTTLLDAIRKSSIATREKGGITQKIGASEIEILHEGKKRKITFIDTPGHEAFANMRSQGVNAADIVLLVIAADDGIKPQTQESIDKIQESKLPFIVVFTKADLPTANTDRVKQQLLAQEVLLEDYGGTVPSIAVSAKTGDHVQELLDLVLLVADVSEIKKTSDAPFLGVVIDAKLDKRRGIVASLVVKQGVLNSGDALHIPGRSVGKVRALFSTDLSGIKTASPGSAVEILGITEVLPAGSLLYTTQQTAHREAAPERSAQKGSAQDLAAFFGERERDILPIVLKTETSGELEAVTASFPEKTEVVYTGQGDISVSDILLAKDFKALVIGFNVGITKEAKALADTEKVFYRLYSIIYEMLDEVRDAAASLAEQDLPTGIAEVIASFDSSEGPVLGIRVTEGKIALHDAVTLQRHERTIGESKIASIKRGKQDVKDVGQDTECGIRLQPPLDFQVGDVVLSHK